MVDKKSFEIFIIKKIPYLTTTLLVLFAIVTLCLIFFSELFSSNKFASEIVVFFFISITDAIVVIKTIYGLLALSMILFFLHFLSKLKIKGVIIFNNDFLEIISKRDSINIKIENIRRVYCNDSEDFNNEPNKKFTLTIETWKNKKILVRIRNTSDIKTFIDKILSYDTLKVDYFKVTTLD